jgi:hypothetical protein
MAERSDFTPAAAVAGFVAGFLAVLLFHQVAALLLWLGGLSPAAPYAMRGVPPLGVPRVISSSFWGGLWGILLTWLLVRRRGGMPDWLFGLIFGALGPTLVAWFVVAPLKGLPAAAGWHPLGMARGLIVNGAWGLGTVLLLAALERVPGLGWRRTAGRGNFGAAD